MQLPAGGHSLKVLVIGSGGREHAVAWRLARCASVEKVYTAPGNPGIAQVAECVPAMTNEQWLALAQEKGIDLTVVGPEAPLVTGLVDLFRGHNLAIFGPTQAAAQLEGSKAFSKAFMSRAGIPTARSITVDTPEDAKRALDQFGTPVVLKADGLAAGKGVVIADERKQSMAAIDELMAARGRLIIEEFLAGEEVSFIVVSDGRNVLPLQPTQDHKQVWDGDRGPNTGGMGAYSDQTILTSEQTSDIIASIIMPTIEHMSSEGNPFTGFLYAGLMMTTEGPKVLEFNARLGDPETQPLMQRLDSDFAEVLLSAARGQLGGTTLKWQNDPSVCVVVSAQGYPGHVKTGDLIHGLDEAEQTGAKVFHAGTKRTEKGLETSGGRVLGVTASAPDLAAAIRHVYSAVAQVHFRGMHYRTDIGAKGLRRSAAW